MRLLRLTLRNWRGIEAREVRFAETGVTVVEGPNESGKSSLVEAVDALIEHYDDSRKREILAAKPVHKDAGAEVEAEIQAGRYRFVYSKRFHKKPETKLVVFLPAPENLTGREAHDRARQILEETVDLALWSALRIEQGQEVAQASLAEPRSLSAGLTKAAGVAQVGETETTLYEAARVEHLRFFTPAGAPRKETTDAEAEVKRLEEEVAQVTGDLARLEDDVERSGQLDREIVDATRLAADSAGSQKRHEERLVEIDRMAVRVREKRSALDAAQTAAKDAKERKTERDALIAEARLAAQARETLEPDDDSAPALLKASKDRDSSEARFDDAARVAEEAERMCALRQRDLDFRREELDLAQLRERKKRIDEADGAATQAETLLAGNPVTDEVLKKLRKSHGEVESARAALNVGSPELRLRALADVAATIDGKQRSLAKGEEATIPVSGSLGLVLPGVAEIEIHTGMSTSNLRDAFDAKCRRFEEMCLAAGVQNLDQAEQANQAWQAAKRDVERRDRVLTDDLRDLTREQVTQKIAKLELRVAAFPLARTDSTPLPADFDTAQEALRAAKAALEVAKPARDVAERRREAARGLVERLREERSKSELAREGARAKAVLTAKVLEQARAKTSDDDLSARLKSAEDAFLLAGATHQTEVERYEAEQPDAARLLAENARKAREGADRRLRKIEDERIQIRARLDERGEAGLAEARDETRTRLETAKDALARRHNHAAAAKLLFETLDEERRKAEAAYVAPLRAQIERLGRIVYGNTFSVEVTEALQIGSRTMDGRTIPFESLSVGAKEQLGVISRLACALIVAPDGGVPVVFDDTLGSTDARRIEAMCALLAMAGRSCQVIVLTCVPERFRQVGGASIIEMA